jgi:hypothetical protein
MAVVTGVTYLTFSTVVTAWKRGMALTDDLHHGDYVVDQLVMALRSAYTVKGSAEYGLFHEDDGGDARSSDMISWVKLGGALVGRDCPFAGSPHRVEFSVEEDDENEPAAAIRAWRLLGQPEDFESEDVPLVFLSRQVTGFDCRCAAGMEDDEIEWLDEWEDTNSLPSFVEITLYMKPIEEGGDPVEMKRVLTIPVAAQSAR